MSEQRLSFVVTMPTHGIPPNVTSVAEALAEGFAYPLRTITVAEVREVSELDDPPPHPAAGACADLDRIDEIIRPRSSWCPDG